MKKKDDKNNNKTLPPEYKLNKNSGFYKAAKYSKEFGGSSVTYLSSNIISKNPLTYNPNNSSVKDVSVLQLTAKKDKSIKFSHEHNCEVFDDYILSLRKREQRIPLRSPEKLSELTRSEPQLIKTRLFEITEPLESRSVWQTLTNQERFTQPQYHSQDCLPRSQEPLMQLQYRSQDYLHNKKTTFKDVDVAKQILQNECNLALKEYPTKNKNTSTSESCEDQETIKYDPYFDSLRRREEQCSNTSYQKKVVKASEDTSNQDNSSTNTVELSRSYNLLQSRHSPCYDSHCLNSSNNSLYTSSYLNSQSGNEAERTKTSKNKATKREALFVLSGRKLMPSAEEIPRGPCETDNAIENSAIKTVVENIVSKKTQTKSESIYKNTNKIFKHKTLGYENPILMTSTPLSQRLTGKQEKSKMNYSLIEEIKNKVQSSDLGPSSSSKNEVSVLRVKSTPKEFSKYEDNNALGSTIKTGVNNHEATKLLDCSLPNTYTDGSSFSKGLENTYGSQTICHNLNQSEAKVDHHGDSGFASSENEISSIEVFKKTNRKQLHYQSNINIFINKGVHKSTATVGKIEYKLNYDHEYTKSGSSMSKQPVTVTDKKCKLETGLVTKMSTPNYRTTRIEDYTHTNINTKNEIKAVKSNLEGKTKEDEKTDTTQYKTFKFNMSNFSSVFSEMNVVTDIQDHKNMPADDLSMQTKQWKRDTTQGTNSLYLGDRGCSLHDCTISSLNYPVLNNLKENIFKNKRKEEGFYAITFDKLLTLKELNILTPDISSCSHHRSAVLYKLENGDVHYAAMKEEGKKRLKVFYTIRNFDP